MTKKNCFCNSSAFPPVNSSGFRASRYPTCKNAVLAANVIPIHPYLIEVNTFGATSSSASSRSIAIPTSDQAAGDLLLLTVSADSGSSSQPAFNTPSGWSFITSRGSAAGLRQNTYFRFDTSGSLSGNTTVTSTSSPSYWAIHLERWRNVQDNGGFLVGPLRLDNVGPEIDITNATSSAANQVQWSCATGATTSGGALTGEVTSGYTTIGYTGTMHNAYRVTTGSQTGTVFYQFDNNFVDAVGYGILLTPISS